MRSKYEERIAANLKARGVAFDYEPARFPYQTQRTYTPDFCLVTSNCTTLWLEAKGYFTPADRTKLLAVKAAHPDLDLRLLFQRASNTIGKKSKTTYAMWADKHGFPWAEGTVPEAWL